MLKTTKKADELIPKIRKISLDWEIKIEIDENFTSNLWIFST